MHPDPDPLLSTLEALTALDAEFAGDVWSVDRRGLNGTILVSSLNGDMTRVWPHTRKAELAASARNALPTLIALARLALEAEELDDSAVDTPRVLSMDWHKRLAALRAGAGKEAGDG